MFAPRRQPRRRRREHAADRSAAGHVDGDGNRVADNVPYGRVADKTGEFGELGVVEVAVGLDGDLDLLIPRTDVAVEAEEAAQVDVAGDRDLEALQRDAAGGGVVDDRAGQARREGVQ